jgi:hypothetical protein
MHSNITLDISHVLSDERCVPACSIHTFRISKDMRTRDFHMYSDTNIPYGGYPKQHTENALLKSNVASPCSTQISDSSHLHLSVFTSCSTKTMRFETDNLASVEMMSCEGTDKKAEYRCCRLSKIHSIQCYARGSRCYDSGQQGGYCCRAVQYSRQRNGVAQ